MLKATSFPGLLAFLIVDKQILYYIIEVDFRNGSIAVLIRADRHLKGGFLFSGHSVRTLDYCNLNGCSKKRSQKVEINHTFFVD